MAGQSTSAGTATSPQSPDSSTSASAPVSPTAIPLGDGKISTTAPAVGYVYSCTSTFDGGGASAVGPWINTAAGTWNATTKLAVEGSVSWPSSSNITVQGETRVITSNDLPDHVTGVFPISPSDPAYAYDHNPNSIDAQSLSYSIPANPTVAPSPTCTGLGPIGIMLSGTVIFNALDAEGRDAGAHELQDSCQGHPQSADEYHYHALSKCISDPGTGHSQLVGYALDGFGIYGLRGENGDTLTNADLDECHGHTHAITWNGQTVTMYHYHATIEYPYTVGCFRGTPIGSGPP
jgi:hypothetical protein